MSLPCICFIHHMKSRKQTSTSTHIQLPLVSFLPLKKKRKACFFLVSTSQTGMNGEVATERLPRCHPVQSTKSAGKTRATCPPVHKHVPLRPAAPPLGVLPQADLFVTRRSTYPALLRRCTRLFFGSTKRSSSLPIPILRFSRCFSSPFPQPHPMDSPSRAATGPARTGRGNPRCCGRRVRTAAALPRLPRCDNVD